MNLIQDKFIPATKTYAVMHYNGYNEQVGEIELNHDQFLAYKALAQIPLGLIRARDKATMKFYALWPEYEHLGPDEIFYLKESN